ncbi:transposase, MuDR, partial [Tanacetum coccineum]
TEIPNVANQTEYPNDAENRDEHSDGSEESDDSDGHSDGGEDSEESDDSDFDVELEDWSEDFYCGQTFPNKEMIKKMVSKISVVNRGQLWLTKNDKVRVRARCRGIVPTF